MISGFNDSSSSVMPIVFIIGAPRSGTYLLVTQLEARLQIAIPVETHFIPLFNKVLFLWGDISKKKRRKILLECIYNFLEIWIPRSERDRDPMAIRKFSLLATKPYAETILANCSSYQELVVELFWEYARLHGVNAAADKSAFYNPISLEQLEKSVPKLKIIHIVRDGRDVSMSWRGIWTGPITVSESARLWKKHIKDKQAWGRINPDSYIEIKYEELLDDPDETLERVSSFLSIGKRGMGKLDQSMASILSTGDTHSKLAGPLDRNNKDKWKTGMGHYDRRLFEFIAGNELRSNGYLVEDSHYTALEKSGFYLLLLCGWFRQFFSIRYWRLQAKNVLPIFTLLARILGFPLVNLLNRRKFPVWESGTIKDDS
jgi:hypothetical protein